MAAWTREMPWRQGSVIALKDLQALQVSFPEVCVGGLIITHDCDLASRYRRHAFPDQLVDRLRPLAGYLEKQLKKHAQAVLGVWIDYQPRDSAAEDELYEVWLYLVYSTDSPDHYVQAADTANNVTNRFDVPLPGLVLTECTAVSEAAFTLADQRSTVEFKFEHLSHRIYPDGAIL